MDRLKTCFVGIGSIAKRHIRNLWDICEENGIVLTIDALRRTDSDLEDEIAEKIHSTYTDADALPHDYDALFLTNPTDNHLDMLCRLHDKSKHFFIEKPLTSCRKLDMVFGIPYRNDSVYHVACPLRYTKVIQYLKNDIDLSSVIAVRCISSSYLPEWRPGSDYRESYSARKEAGGGVSIDLIHEWDYIQYLFGIPEKIYYSFGKKSKLDISSEDYAVYIGEYRDKVVELHLDYFGRKTIREVMLFTDDDIIVGDLVAGKVTYLKQDKEIYFEEERDYYQKKELMSFLDMLDGKIRCENGIREAYQTILLTQGRTE